MDPYHRLNFRNLKPSQVPKNWPSDVCYTSIPLGGGLLNHTWIHEKVSQAPNVMPVRQLVKLPQGPIPNVKIQSVKEQAHPACGQNGLFAANNLAPDSFILLYCGVIHGPDDQVFESNYDLSLDREKSIGIDAARIGNEARFINDYRGVRDEGPNAEFRDVWVDLNNGDAQKGIGIFVLSAGKGKDSKRTKGIRKGDEILVSYGKGFWTHRKQDDSDIVQNPPSASET